MPETQQQCDRRVAGAIQQWLPRLQADGLESALLIGHGASCESMMRCLIPGFCEEGQSCCGLSLVRLDDRGGPARLEFHNDTSHL